MTNLVILSHQKQCDFDTPSKLNAKKRTAFFSLDHEMMAFTKSLRTPVNQVGFVLQLGYFRVNGKFLAQSYFLRQLMQRLDNLVNPKTNVEKAYLF